MNTETARATEQTADPAEVGQVMGQLMADLAATSGMLLTVIGVRTGLWESLAAEPATPSELAAQCFGVRTLRPRVAAVPGRGRLRAVRARQRPLQPAGRGGGGDGG